MAWKPRPRRQDPRIAAHGRKARKKKLLKASRIIAAFQAFSDRRRRDRSQQLAAYLAEFPGLRQNHSRWFSSARPANRGRSRHSVTGAPAAVRRNAKGPCQYIAQISALRASSRKAIKDRFRMRCDCVDSLLPQSSVRLCSISPDRKPTT